MSRLFKILAICGACISFYIGAGFATMQEVMQYEASYGSKFCIVIIVTAIIYVYTNLSFATNGSRLCLERGGDIYKIYCKVLGSRLGKLTAAFFDYFSALFCFMSFVVMCGGANSTLTQQWGLPFGVGAVILTGMVVATVVFGLQGIVQVLGKIGPVIIAMILLVSSITALTGWGDFQINLLKIDLGSFKDVMEQVGEEILLFLEHHMEDL